MKKLLKDRLKKLLSREFLTGLLPFIVGVVALFVKPVPVEFEAWALWSAVFLGLSGAQVSGQKVVEKIKSAKGGSDV